MCVCVCVCVCECECHLSCEVGVLGELGCVLAVGELGVLVLVVGVLGGYVISRVI